jgi:hypothetical protein
VPPTTQNASDDSDDDDLLEDDIFMQQFRQQRLAEMTATAGNTSSSSGVVDNTNKPLPYFGEVIDIDEFDPHEVLQGKTGEPAARLSSRHDFFLHHLSNTDSRVTTVVHTYEPDIKVGLFFICTVYHVVACCNSREFFFCCHSCAQLSTSI